MKYSGFFSVLQVWLAVSVSGGGLQELPPKVSEFQRVASKVARVGRRSKVAAEAAPSAAAPGLLHFLPRSLARNKPLKANCHQGGFEEVSEVEVVGWSASWSSSASPPQAASVSRQPLRASAQGRRAGLPA